MDDEFIVQFSGRLKRLVEDCECTSLTVQAHKDYLVPDAFVSRLRSDDIWARLLEQEVFKSKKTIAANRLHVLLNYPMIFRKIIEGLSLQLWLLPFSQTTRQQLD